MAANGANGIVDDSGTVNISDASTVAEVTAIKTAMDQNGAASVQGTTLNYSLEDTAALINAAAAAYKTGATSISITDATVTVAAATRNTSASLMASTRYPIQLPTWLARLLQLMLIVSTQL